MHEIPGLTSSGMGSGFTRSSPLIKSQKTKWQLQGYVSLFRMAESKMEIDWNFEQSKLKILSSAKWPARGA